MNSSDIAVPDVPATPTDPSWVEIALADLDALLCDHLHCERKAAQSALSLMRAYPDRPELAVAVARLAHEETSHVLQVAQLLARRGVELRFDQGDDYAAALRALVRKREPGRLIDHLLVAALIEGRSAERLSLLADALPPAGEMAALYRALAGAEMRHRDTFLELAFGSAPTAAAEIAARTAELAAAEAEIAARLPLRPRIH